MVISYQKSPFHDLSIAARRVRHGRDFAITETLKPARRAAETGPESRVEKGRLTVDLPTKDGYCP